jgi:hypothetical protein
MALLHGVAGPIAGKTYEAPMAPLGGNDDAWIAAVASYVRTSFGNQSPLISADEVARVRAAHAERKDAWTLAELNAHLPRPVENRSAWRLTTNRAVASGETAGDAATIGPAALTFSAKAPAAGAWLQIELPVAITLSELRLSSVSAPRNYTRAYKIELSNDGENWGEPVAAGRGLGPIVDVAFAPTQAKWIRITHTQPFGFGRGSSGGSTPGGNVSASNAAGDATASGRGPPQNDWTLDDVRLFQPAAPISIPSQ